MVEIAKDPSSGRRAGCPPKHSPGWGWSRAGWSWQEWWVLAERLLGNVDHESAMLVLRQALQSRVGQIVAILGNTVINSGAS